MNGLADGRAQTTETRGDPLGSDSRERARAIGACVRRIEDLEKATDAAVQARRRLAADFRSYRWRTAQEAWTARRAGTRGVLLAVLPVLDDLEGALAQGSTDTAFLHRLQAIVRVWHRVLEDLGLRPVPGVGVRFDPRVHEAVGMATSADIPPDGTIVAEILPGYLHEEEPLRLAKVIVGRGTQSGPGFTTHGSDGEGGVR
jgi:molecular chaperone GrpE